jgi:hypothetical protein
VTIAKAGNPKKMCPHSILLLSSCYRFVSFRLALIFTLLLSLFPFYLSLSLLFCPSVTPWSRVFLEKLIAAKLVQNFPTFYCTQKFITLLTEDHDTAPYPEPVGSSPYSHTLSLLRSIFMLSSHLHLCVPSGLSPSGFA